MTLIYALGNPGIRYQNTKHNAGRLVLEALAKKLDLSWKDKEGYFFCKTKFETETLYFLLSKDYMNTSGKALASFCNFFKLDFDQAPNFLFLLQDDSDQQEGSYKLRAGGGSAGHRGVDSVYKSSLTLGVELNKIWRLKIGIRPANNKLKSETFVLKKATQQELQTYQLLADKLATNLSWIASQNLTKAQNFFNSN